jgi:anti-sigma regulatory factor (Ser/Thr protein kinase)
VSRTTSGDGTRESAAVQPGALIGVAASLTLHVRSTTEAIGPATEAAEAWLADQRAGQDASFLVSLAIEELVSNSIKYGYDDALEHTIAIVLSVADSLLTMVVIDDGHAFNPLAVPPPDLSGALEHRTIGGLGIHLVRKLADDMTYERRNETNRITIVKRVSS